MQFALAGWSRQIPHIEGVIAHDSIAKDSGQRDYSKQRPKRTCTTQSFSKVLSYHWILSLNCNDHHWPVFCRRRSDLVNCTLDWMFAIFCGVMWDGMCRDKASPEGYRRIKERLFQIEYGKFNVCCRSCWWFLSCSRSHLSQESGGTTLSGLPNAATESCQIMPPCPKMIESRDIELLSDRQKFFPRCWGTGTTIESAACLQHCCGDV